MEALTLDVNVEVQISAIIHVSEDLLKVLIAIKNICGNADPIEKQESNNLVIWKFNSLKVLNNFYRKIRERQIITATKKLLLRNITKDSTSLLLNRQAAFVGNIVLCDEEAESPLGPIILKIESPELMQVIDWLIGEQKTENATNRVDRS
jgi:predicted RNA binding protein with dsRBD fold (UPF0201 family)